MTTPDLTAAVERLYGQLEFCGADWRKDLRLVLTALEESQQDASRYRWLRDQMWSQAFTNLYAIPVAFADTADKAGEGIDAAIDAAMGDGDA